MRSPSVAPRTSSTTARPQASHARKPQPCARTWRPTPSGLSALLLPRTRTIPSSSSLPLHVLRKPPSPSPLRRGPGLPQSQLARFGSQDDPTSPPPFSFASRVSNKDHQKLKKASENGLITILNPAPACKIKDDDFELIDFFTPNETEAEFYLNKKIETEKDIKNASEEFLKKGIKNIVITLGERGCYFANKKENFFVEAFKLKDPVLDTTGAGDAFNGALAVGLSKNLDIKEALNFANKVAAISTTRQGAAASMPSFDDVKNY